MLIVNDVSETLFWNQKFNNVPKKVLINIGNEIV